MLHRGQGVPMTGAFTEGGTIFMFERKTLWLSDMQGKTNWLRIWGIITGVEVLRGSHTSISAQADLIENK